MKVEFNDFNLSRFSCVAETSAGKNQEQNPEQQQDAPGRAQFFQDGPEKFQHRVEDTARLGLLRRRAP